MRVVGLVFVASACGGARSVAITTPVPPGTGWYCYTEVYDQGNIVSCKRTLAECKDAAHFTVTLGDDNATPDRPDPECAPAPVAYCSSFVPIKMTEKDRTVDCTTSREQCEGMASHEGHEDTSVPGSETACVEAH